MRIDKDIYLKKNIIILCILISNVSMGFSLAFPSIFKYKYNRKLMQEYYKDSRYSVPKNIHDIVENMNLTPFLHNKYLINAWESMFKLDSAPFLGRNKGVSLIVVHTDRYFDRYNETAKMINMMRLYPFSEIYQHTLDFEDAQRVHFDIKHKILHDYISHKSYMYSHIHGHEFILSGLFYDMCHYNMFKSLLIRFIKSYFHRHRNRIIIHFPRQFIYYKAKYNYIFDTKILKASFKFYLNLLNEIKNIYGINYSVNTISKVPIQLFIWDNYIEMLTYIRFKKYFRNKVFNIRSLKVLCRCM